MSNKPTLKFWQIWNMGFGFLGIQFGWGLQMANMSAIYEYLGASPETIPMLWLAAPLTGLLVQPIIGQMSDRTWNRLGRRRPYFLVGAILSSIALILMPNSSTLWMAAGLLWILDASINISMEPFRAFVADMLPEKQRTRGFAMQSFFIGLGAIIASSLPWILTNMAGFGHQDDGNHAIPATVRWSFYIGAAAFLGAVLWTIFSTKEYPPDDPELFRKRNRERKGVVVFMKEIFAAIANMPSTMKQLARVQFFTWLGLFCMWLYFTVAISRNVFGATDTSSPLYREGQEWAGLCFAMYSLVCFIFAFFLPAIANRIGMIRTHALSLLCGAAGLLSVGVIQNQYLLLLSMTGVGIAWASILSMPYAILSSAIPPEKTGIYMGIFNFFIVLPEIIAALAFGWVMNHLLDNNRLLAVVAGGVFLFIAALLTLGVKQKKGVTMFLLVLLLAGCNTRPSPPEAPSATAGKAELIQYAALEQEYLQKQMDYNKSLLLKVESEYQAALKDLKPTPQADRSLCKANGGKSILFIHNSNEVRIRDASRESDTGLLIFRETDPEFRLSVYPSASGMYLFIESSREGTTEIHMRREEAAVNSFQCITPRKTGHQYHVNHFGGPYLWILSNQNAPNRKLFVTPVTVPGEKGWNTAILHNDSVYIDGYSVLNNEFLVLLQRKNMTIALQVTEIVPDERNREKVENKIVFNEPMGFIENLTYEPEEQKIVFHYTSLKSPTTCYTYGIQSRKLSIRWQRKVAGYDPSQYQATVIPVNMPGAGTFRWSLVQRSDMAYTDGSNPALVMLPGREKEPPLVSLLTRLSLLNRGFGILVPDPWAWSAATTLQRIAAVKEVTSILSEKKYTTDGLVSLRTPGEAIAGNPVEGPVLLPEFKTVIVEDADPGAIKNEIKSSVLFLGIRGDHPDTWKRVGDLRRALPSESTLWISGGAGPRPLVTEEIMFLLDAYGIKE